MARISKKAHLAFYNRASSKDREFYRKLLTGDIIKSYNFISYRFYLLNKDELNRQIIQEILDSQNFGLMIDLYNRLTETAHAIDRLEKYFQKLSKQ